MIRSGWEGSRLRVATGAVVRPEHWNEVARWGRCSAIVDGAFSRICPGPPTE